MREILFKAKRLNNGEWVEGYYVKTELDVGYHHCIASEIVGEWAEVIPETVCQYTGLTDKNGVKIFEGDKVKQGIEIREVFYGICAWRLSRPNTTAKNLEPRSDKYEIIGNIHDKEKQC